MPSDSIIQMNSDLKISDMTCLLRFLLKSLVTHYPLGPRTLIWNILFSDYHNVQGLNMRPTLYF
jgi:hypothetical protein